MSRKAVENVRRTLASLLANEAEKAFIIRAVEKSRADAPTMAEVSVNSFVRAATIKLAEEVLKEKFEVRPIVPILPILP